MREPSAGPQEGRPLHHFGPTQAGKLETFSRQNQSKGKVICLLEPSAGPQKG
jgi:hypothetical protein